MTNFVTTKRALLTSVLSLTLCFAMLLGTTFAWFTDTVTSSGNVIQTGDLDVEMYYAAGTEDPATAGWKNADGVAIFNYDNWEPGYADAKHIKIVNAGTLAFNWMLRITSSNTVSDLAEVIDVYYFATADAYTRSDLANARLLGTLRDVMNTDKNISRDVNGTLYPAGTENVPADKVGKTEFTLVLVMQEDAGNEYQNLSIGSDLSIEVFATQVSHEEDSFDNTYDNDVHSLEVPAAYVRPISPNEVITTNPENVVVVDKGIAIKASGPIDFSGFKIDTNLDAAYQFLPTETLAEAQNSEYRYWHADYVISCDRDVKPDANGNPTLAIAGYYDAWCSLNDDEWVALASTETITAGTEIRLVSGLGGGGINVSYEEICEYGNDGLGFMCGAVDLDGSNAGATLTVELRLYEVTKKFDGSGTSGTLDSETGNYITIGEFNYTFGGEWITEEDGTVLWAQNDGEVVLYDTQDVETANYTVPEGVTKLGNYCFSYTDAIETVTLPESVKSLGRAFDSNSSIKKVVLNEGLETIDSRAFRLTSALEEVVISSTVKTIADNAFQKSGIKTITIPATVETIGETAFGASLIETVIIEGNTSIQGYAFRGCTKLRTVYLNGDDVTFIASTLNGINSTWFCNGESNNSKTSTIDFYVKNDVVAARVRTAMGADKENVTVTIQ